MTKTKTKARPRKRKRGEGTRGPRKGSGGRPPKSPDRRGRSILLCDLGEWPRLTSFSEGASFTDRVRFLLDLAKGKRADAASVSKRWSKTAARKTKATMAEPRERSIYLGAGEWALVAKMFPSGSWADKVRQLVDVADVKGEEKRAADAAEDEKRAAATAREAARDREKAAREAAREREKLAKVQAEAAAVKAEQRRAREAARLKAARELKRQREKLAKVRAEADRIKAEQRKAREAARLKKARAKLRKAKKKATKKAAKAKAK